MREVWREYLGYGVTAEIEIDFDTGEMLMRPQPGTFINYPDFDALAFAKAHRALLQKVYDDVAKNAGRTIVSKFPEIDLPGVGTVPACTIAASPRKPILGIKTLRWGVWKPGWWLKWPRIGQICRQRPPHAPMGLRIAPRN